MRSFRLTPALASTLLLAAAAAVPGGSLASDDARACVTIDGDAARLACYDKALGRAAPMPTARSTGPAAVAATPAAVAGAQAAPAAAQPVSPASEFGLSESAKRAKNPAKPAEPQSVSARIVSIRWQKYGEFVVTLDNGQVWEQIEPMPAAAVKIGDSVTVKKALLGSYTLLTANRVPTKVRRID